MKKRFSLSAGFLGLCVLLAAACGTADEAATDESAPGAPASASAAAEAPVMTAAAPTLSQAEAIGLRNARAPMDGVVTGGQPTQDQLTELVDAGFHRFVSLRPASENGAGWEEAFAGTVSADFARIPVAGAGDLTRANVEALDRLLGEAGDEDTVLYCASGNRVGALLALRAYWLKEVPAEEALGLGLSAGLTGLEPAVRQLMGLN